MRLIVTTICFASSVGASTKRNSIPGAAAVVFVFVFEAALSLEPCPPLGSADEPHAHTPTIATIANKERFFMLRPIADAVRSGHDVVGAANPAVSSMCAHE